MKAAWNAVAIVVFCIGVTGPLSFALCEAPKKPAAQQSSVADAAEGVGLGFFRQKESPLVLVETQHGVEDVLLKATLLNAGNDKIAGYRLAWWVKCPDDSSEIVRGKLISFSSSLLPKQKRVDGPFEVPGALLSSGAVEIRFFVDEVQFENGKTWKADRKKIKKEA